MSGCGRTLFWIGFTERTISNLKHSTHNIYSKLSTIVVPRQNGPCQEKNRLFLRFSARKYDFCFVENGENLDATIDKDERHIRTIERNCFRRKNSPWEKTNVQMGCKAARSAFFCTTSQALRASSPGRGAIGRPGQPCCSHRPNRAQSGGPCPNGQQLRNCALTKDVRQAAVNLDSGARSFTNAKNFARPARPSPTRQGLPYQGSWHCEAMTERFSPHLPISMDDVLIAAQLLQPHRAAGMELLGGDAHLTA